MKTNILFLSIFLFSLHCQSQYVLFGERNLEPKITAIYFDQQGTIYPDYLIPDAALFEANGNLSTYYDNNPAIFLQISQKYNCAFATYNSTNLGILQDSIFKQKARKVNFRNDESISFLIHGYRKSFVAIENGSSSVEEFKILRDKLDSLQLKSTAYIEVYWDGTYDCCFSSHKKKNDSLFRQFEYAQQNAPKIGFALRQFMVEISAPTLNVISHSLGCKVATASLFNIVPSSVPTPQNRKINLCLIAPAIGSDIITQNYYKRNTTQNFAEKDNYQLIILYNPKDFVLRKKDNKFGVFGPGVKKYGETSLGCNYRNEAKNLVKYFNQNFPHSAINIENMAELGKNHSLKIYASGDHLEELVRLINVAN